MEDLLAQRRITVSYETIRCWCIKFCAKYTRWLKRKHPGYGDTFYLDEVFVRIGGKQHHLWRAVDQDGKVVDVFLQRKRDATAAKRFFKRLLRSHGEQPRTNITDKISVGQSASLVLERGVVNTALLMGSYHLVSC